MKFLVQLVLIQAIVEITRAQSCGGNPSYLNPKQCATVNADATVVKQKGLGLNCQDINRSFWSKVQLTQNHITMAATALRDPVPAFDSKMYTNTSIERGAVDWMMYKGFQYFWPLVLEVCKDPSKKDYLEKAKKYVENLVSWPSWADFTSEKHYRKFKNAKYGTFNESYVYYNKKQYYTVLFSCKYICLNF
jgi:hypothetical protein